MVVKRVSNLWVSLSLIGDRDPWVGGGGKNFFSLISKYVLHPSLFPPPSLLCSLDGSGGPVSPEFRRFLRTPHAPCVQGTGVGSPQSHEVPLDPAPYDLQSRVGGTPLPGGSEGSGEGCVEEQEWE